MKKFLLLPVMYVALLMTSCDKDKVPASTVDPNCPDTIRFSTQILPMMQNNCTGCHDTGNSTGYTINDHASTAANATAILGAMKQDGFQLMPQGGPALHDTLIQQFSCWISQGKLNN